MLLVSLLAHPSYACHLCVFSTIFATPKCFPYPLLCMFCGTVGEIICMLLTHYQGYGLRQEVVHELIMCCFEFAEANDSVEAATGSGVEQLAAAPHISQWHQKVKTCWELVLGYVSFHHLVCEQCIAVISLCYIGYIHGSQSYMCRVLRVGPCHDRVIQSHPAMC